MTDIEKFNLLWLCHAMTAPTRCDERYYYDGSTKKLFYTKPSTLNPDELILLDMLDLYIVENEFKTLSKLLEHVDSEVSKIVEIPRLNVQDKAAIQLLFLSKFPGMIHDNGLKFVVEQQKDAYGFVLDSVLSKNDALAPMLPYWEDFKLKTIQYYLEKFTGVVGIALKLSQ